MTTSIDDMILVSIDDHVIEPATIFSDHVPGDRRDEFPKIVEDDQGTLRWVFQGIELGTTGLNAVVSWPKEEWDNDPIGYAEMRPGCYDVHQRVRDMDANGVLASMNFPTFPGFSGTHLMGAPDRKLSNLVVSAYNDWHLQDWAGAYPGRFIPLAILPMWDLEATVAEVRRLATLGFTAVTFPETPYAVGLPSFYTDHWDPVLRALCDADIALCMHIGSAFKLLQRPPEAPLDQQIVMSPQLSALACCDLMLGGVFKRFPDLRVAMSEGGIGWIPSLLDRMEHTFRTQVWMHLDAGGGSPTEIFQRNFLGCFISSASTLRMRDRIGIRSIAWECDYPHSDSTWPRSPELLHAELTEARLDGEEVELVTWQNASRFFRYDPFTIIPQAQASVGALRSIAVDVDTATTSRAVYHERYRVTA